MSNAPDRYEKFVVPEGVLKIDFEKDTRVPNAGTFIIQREDHTIGNLLRMKLHEDNQVTFAGYKIPHPLEYQMLIKVQTNGSKTPMDALHQSLESLNEEVSHIRSQFLSAKGSY